VQAAVEAQRADASADVPRVGLEDRRAMTALLELVGAHQAREPGADDHDVDRPAWIRRLREQVQRRCRRCSDERREAAQELAA
jgi:hypothetical protein